MSRRQYTRKEGVRHLGGILTAVGCHELAYLRDIHLKLQAFGFLMVRDEGDFAELQWEDAPLFLEANPNAPPSPSFPAGNIRILVSNADDYWTLSQQMGVQVIRPLENRSYGLRDFTIAGPDGLDLRFATRLTVYEQYNTDSENE